MTTEQERLVADTRALLDAAAGVYAGTPVADAVAALIDRFDQPLRVAIAGKVKAGKSTLLNALVGQKLAPTDEGECTRIVTWYRDGTTYRVEVELPSGERRQLRFHKDEGAIDVDLGGLDANQVGRLEVTWPSPALREVTLIDTPGIGSLSRATSQRAIDFLTPDDESTPADAVLYLMRHLHRNDTDFLQAFHDTEVSQPNPVNAVAVLSRADEIGAGRLDSIESAKRIATRYSDDPRVRKLVQTVVPVAGLLAETAASLTEDEYRWLKLIAAEPAETTDRLLLSADRFVDDSFAFAVTSYERELLLGRLGVFGVRLGVDLIRREQVATATELSRELVRHSGLDDLRHLLASLFADRRDLLKARSALLALDDLVRANPSPGSADLDNDIERVLASAHPLSELRLLSSIRCGWIEGKPEQLAELERLVGGHGPGIEARLGLAPGADRAAVGAELQATLGRWQARAESPMTSHQMAQAARVAIRSCEGLISTL